MFFVILENLKTDKKKKIASIFNTLQRFLKSYLQLYRVFQGFNLNLGKISKLIILAHF